MKRVVIRLLAGLTVGLVFFFTLLLNWPLAGLASVLPSASPFKLERFSGTLTKGGVGRVVMTASGWPIALGPFEWQLTWPPAINTQLGQAPTAWQINGEWRGLKTRWRIRGGDLSALDLTQLPVALSAHWEGELLVTFQGRQCLSSSGALTAAPLQLLSPTPMTLGNARLRLVCAGSAPELLLTLEDGEALSLEMTATLNASGGSARARGFVKEQHPLTEWRVLLSPVNQGNPLEEQVDQYVTW